MKILIFFGFAKEPCRKCIEMTFFAWNVLIVFYYLHVLFDFHYMVAVLVTFPHLGFIRTACSQSNHSSKIEEKKTTYSFARLRLALQHLNIIRIVYHIYILWCWFELRCNLTLPYFYITCISFIYVSF